jgi:hypothetical protein
MATALLWSQAAAGSTGKLMFTPGVLVPARIGSNSFSGLNERESCKPGHLWGVRSAVRRTSMITSANGLS